MREIKKIWKVCKTCSEDFPILVNKTKRNKYVDEICPTCRDRAGRGVRWILNLLNELGYGEFLKHE